MDVNGLAVFDFLGVGTYRLVARSLADAANGGEGTVTVTAGQAATREISLRGVGAVTVTVVQADGVTPVASARVRLNARATTQGQPASALATSFDGFTDGAGHVTFQGVPVGEYFASAEAAALAGVNGGSIASPGQAAATTVQLGASATIAGRVLLPDGTTPAARAIVTLQFTPQVSQTGTLQVTTGLAGTFEFTGIPLGAFTLSAFEVASNGVRSSARSLSAAGQRFEAGDLVLDNAGPRVTSIEPVESGGRRAGATGHRADVQRADGSWKFCGGSERQAPGRHDQRHAAAARVLERQSYGHAASGSGAAQQRSVFGDAARRARRPSRRGSRAADSGPVRRGVRYTGCHSTGSPLHEPGGERAAGGPRRQRSRQLLEPIAGGTLVVRDNAGVVQAGQTALTAGHTAIAFAPAAFLRANTAYTATLANVVDTAGNALTTGPASFTFTTLDTLAPEITALNVVGTPRPLATLTVTPAVAGGDVQRVEYLAGNAGTLVATVPPFSANVVVPNGVPSFVVTATAFDLVGNRSTAFSRTVDVVPNAAPTVTLRSVTGATVAAQGQTSSSRRRRPTTTGCRASSCRRSAPRRSVRLASSRAKCRRSRSASRFRSP